MGVTARGPASEGNGVHVVHSVTFTHDCTHTSTIKQPATASPVRQAKQFLHHRRHVRSTGRSTLLLLLLLLLLWLGAAAASALLRLPWRLLLALLLLLAARLLLLLLRRWLLGCLITTAAAATSTAAAAFVRGRCRVTTRLPVQQRWAAHGDAA
jgi:hypothetical protein